MNNYLEQPMLYNYDKKEYDKIDYDSFFTKLTPLLTQISNLQTLVNNDDIVSYNCQSTSAPFLINKVETLLKIKKPKELTTFFIMKFATKRSFILGGLFYFIFEFNNCIGLFLLDIITSELITYNPSSENSTLLLYIILLIFVYFFKTYCGGKYSWYQIQWKIECRASIQYIMFKKALLRKYYAFKEQNNNSEEGGDNEQENDEQELANINNLITVDVNVLDNLFWGFHTTWINVIVIIMLLFMLYQKLQDTMFEGLLVLSASIVFNLTISGIIQLLFKYALKKKDERISLSTDIIEGIKSIKSLGWEKIFEKKINAIRNKEFKYIFSIRGLDALMSLFWNTIAHFLLFVFLICYVNGGHSLQDSNIFTIIALFTYLTFPIGIIPWAIGDFIRVLNSIKRIDLFLKQEEIQLDLSQNQQQYTEPYRSDSISSVYQQENLQSIIKIEGMQFIWPNLEIDKKKSLPKQNIVVDIDDQQQPFNLFIDQFLIKENQLYFVIGKIGCGKTALCHSILNEMTIQQYQNNNYSVDVVAQRQESFSSLISQDEIEKYQMKSFLLENNIQFQIHGSIAYVSQNHWLQNKTIKDNILFYKEYDKYWYQTCLNVCQLQIDLNEFEQGDQHIIGPGGNNLSGGQKQRISLCRAIYQNKDIYIFDDIFSSLDVHVADAIFKEAICDLLITKLKKTVILVTSHYRFINNNQDYQLIYMDKGRIIKDQEMSKQFLMQQQQQEIKDEKQHEIQEVQLLQENISIDQEQSTDEDLENFQQVKLPILQKKQSSKSKPKIKQYEEENVEIEEYRDQGNIKNDTYMTYFKAFSISIMIISIIFHGLMQASSIVIDFWLRSQIRENDSSFDFINDLFNNNFSATFTFLILINLGLAFIRVILFFLGAQMAAKKLFNRLNKHIIYSKMKFFDKNSSGKIINRLSEDIFTIDDELPWFLQIFFECFMESVAMPVGIFIQFPWMVIFIGFAIIMIYYVQKIYRQVNREIKRLNSVNTGKVLTHINEVCKGLVTIRSMQKEKSVIDEYIYRLDKSIITIVISNSLLCWMQVRMWMVSNILIFLVGISCFFMIILKIDFDYSLVAMTMTYSILLATSFCDSVEFFCGFETRMVSVERVRQYLQNEQENLEESQKDKLFLNQMNNSKQDYAIIYNDVMMTYNQDQNIHTQQCQYALKHFSLQIKKGEKIAFCGRTGSGKTSILNTLFRLYPIQSGQIFINNMDISKISLKQLRDQMSIIPQFGFLYNASLKDNLDPNNNLTNNEVQRIIDKSGLKIKTNDNSSNNNQQKQDLDLVIEQSGGNISNGEKQIINFLRVLMQNRDIICLDEATSNMDPQTDQMLHEKLFQYVEGKTLLVITHRLENIDKFDRIIVLDKGEIVEQGHASELRNRKNGFFNKLLKQNISDN